MDIVYCFLSEEQYVLVSELVSVPDLRIVPVSCGDWNRDLSPWPASKVFPKGDDFSGGADAFLEKLLTEIIPEAERGMEEKAERRYLAGYSLAGLFAAYAAFRTDRFDGIASMSGSMWFDRFTDYAEEHSISPNVKKAYFSLGDREKNAKEHRMKTVETCTGIIADIFGSSGVETVFEMNEGGHFRDAPGRIAKGILWLADRT